MKDVTVRELVDFIRSIQPDAIKEIHGDLDRVFNCYCPVEISHEKALSFSTREILPCEYKGVILCSAVPWVVYNANIFWATYIIVDNPRLWFIRAHSQFFHIEEKEGVDPTAILNPCVKMGLDVQVKPYAAIGFSGFGYEKNEKGQYEHFPHNGGVVIGDDVSIGSQTCIDRGTLGDTVIGDGTKIDNLVHIAHNVKIGRNCLITALSCIGGSVEIEDDVTVWMGAMIRDHIKIGRGAVVGMGAVVTKDVKPYTTVIGVPAKPIGEKK